MPRCAKIGQLSYEEGDMKKIKKATQISIQGSQAKLVAKAKKDMQLNMLDRSPLYKKRNTISLVPRNGSTEDMQLLIPHNDNMRFLLASNGSTEEMKLSDTNTI